MMTLGEQYFLAHPRLAFAVHAITTIALGYISNRIQQYWYPESFLLLHIAGWWTLSMLWLLHLANKPKLLAPSERDLQHFNYCLRLHALLFGERRSFHDIEAEQAEDFPQGTPLFRSICLSIQRWRLSSLTVSPDIGEQFARLTGPNEAQVTLHFDHWGFAWYIGITEFRGNEDEVRDFLESLNIALSHIDGLSKIQWYFGEPDLFHAQMSDAEIQLGSDSPFDAAQKS